MYNKAYVITIKDDPLSNECADKLIMSRAGNFEHEITKFDAIIPERVISLMTLHNLKWNYPMSEPVLDMQTGMWKHPYKTAVTEKRIACFLSHYLLWQQCAKSQEGMFIFEHDALFIRNVDVRLLNLHSCDIIGLNDPRGATRRAEQYHHAVQHSMHYHHAVQHSMHEIVSVPKIDVDEVPQGLPGNSAYFIKPAGAIKLLRLVTEYGAWPNDAIMCRQLMPKKLGVLRQYATKVQGVASTTTL